jgi:anaerobic ribonucleoside-triphosphate reductase
MRFHPKSTGTQTASMIDEQSAYVDQEYQSRTKITKHFSTNPTTKEITNKILRENDEVDQLMYRFDGNLVRRGRKWSEQRQLCGRKQRKNGS